MDLIFGQIIDAINGFLISVIEANLSAMFVDINENVGSIAEQVGKTPSQWNNGIFNLIKSLSENVIVPVAGLVVSFVLCYELINLIIDRNNMHDIDTFIFFKYFFKAVVAVIIVSNAFNIIMAVFDMGQYIVSNSAGVIGKNTSVDISSAIADIKKELETVNTGELFLIVIETSLVSLCMKILSVFITVIVFGRMIEIYLYCSVGAIPLATMTNREWGQMGGNYLRGLLALGFQGFFIMICVGIYAVLVNSFTVTSNLHTTIFSVSAYTVTLCFALFKTDSISKSIFNAH